MSALCLATALASGAAPCLAGEWVSLGPGGGHVRSIVIDPTPPATVFAGSRLNGVFASGDGGGSWSPASGGLTSVDKRTETLAVGADGALYAALGSGGQGLLTSSDGGASWSRLHATAGPAMAVDPSNTAILYASGANGEVLKSTDAGGSWTPHTDGLPALPVRLLRVDPVTPSTLYAGLFADGVYKSTDGGQSWAAASSGLDPNTRVTALAPDPSAPQVLYLGTETGSVFKSTDGGAGWSAVAAGIPAGEPIGALAVVPGTPTRVFAGRLGALYASEDAGASWLELSAPVDGLTVNDFAVDPASPAVLFAATNAGVLKSTDAGASWTEADEGIEAHFVDRIVPDSSTPRTLYLATEAGHFKSSTGGASWAEVNTGLPRRQVQELALVPGAPQTLYAAVFEGGAFRTQDGAASWTSAVHDPSQFGGVFPPALTAVAVHPTDGDTAFVGNFGNETDLIPGAGLYRTVDGGENWTPVFEPVEALALFQPVSIAIDPADPDRIFVGNLLAEEFGSFSYNVLRTLDGGANWTEVQRAEGFFFPMMAIDPHDGDTVYAALSGSGEILRSVDGGDSWTPLGADLDCILSFLVDPVVPDVLFAGCDPVFVSEDGGGTWTQFSAEGFPLEAGGARALAVEATSPRRLYAGTFQGVYAYEITAILFSDGFESGDVSAWSHAVP